MVGSFVTLFQWRSDFVLLQENEILLAMRNQILSFVSKLDEVESFVVHLVFQMMHAHEMAECFLKLSELKLKKKINDQMVSLIRPLDKVTRVAGDMERIRAFCQIWVSELKVMLHEVEDCVNDFMIKVLWVNWAGSETVDCRIQK